MNRGRAISLWFYSALFLLSAFCTSITGMQVILPWQLKRLLSIEFLFCCRLIHPGSGYSVGNDNFLFVAFAALLSVSAFFGFLLIKMIRTRCIVRRLAPITPVEAWPGKFVEVATSLPLEQSALKVVKSETLFAICSGLLHPKIYLSTSLLEGLSRKQLEAVLLHERSHLRHFDPLRILVADTIGAVCIFFPVIRDLVAHYKVGLEMRADRAAINHAGRPALAGALARMLALDPLSRPVGSLAVASLSANATRIAALLGDRIPTNPVSRKSLLHSTISLGLVCMLTMSI